LFVAAPAALAQAGPPAPPPPPAVAAHPGSSTYAYATLDTTKFTLKDSFFGAGYVTEVRVPRGAQGKLPLVVFAHGKALYFSSTLYGAFLDHLARKGAIVASVEYEGYLAGIVSTDHGKFARRFLRGMQETLRRYPQADASQVVFVGHSLGARVAVVAAAYATGQDAQGAIPDPTALVLHAFDDSRPPTGASRPAVLGASGVARDVARSVEVTVLEYAGDTTAGPQKGYAQGLYDALAVDRKQWIRAKSYATDPRLTTDHLTPLSGGPAWTPGGTPRLDALDRHFVWKITAGVILARTGRDPLAAPYAYGNLREDGGTASNGGLVRHEVVRQSF